MMREIATPTMLHDGSSFGAMAGVTAAIQAELGFTGAPAVTVEDREVICHWEDLGKSWQTLLQYIKPYPTCRWTHAAIDGLQSLFNTHDFATEEIARIDVRTFFNAVELFNGVPESSSVAQYSMKFPLAVMAVHRRVGVEHVSGAGLSDAAVIEMMERLHVAEGPEHSASYPAKRHADVKVTLTDGRVLETGTIHARGGPESPFGRAEIIEKFFQFASPVLGEPRARAICERVLSLTSNSSRFSELADLIYDPPGH